MYYIKTGKSCDVTASLRRANAVATGKSDIRQ